MKNDKPIMGKIYDNCMTTESKKTSCRFVVKYYYAQLNYYEEYLPQTNFALQLEKFQKM